MIKVTSISLPGYKVYLNPFWIESVMNNIETGETEIFVHGDYDNPYIVAESVEEIVDRIEDDRWEVSISQ